MNDKREFLDLLENMRQSVNKIGVKSTTLILQKGHLRRDEMTEKVDHIIEVVIKFYGDIYTRQDLFKSNVRGDVIVFRDTIIVLVNRTTFLCKREIADLLNVTYDTVRRVLWTFSKLDQENKFDKLVIERINKLLTQIK